MWVFLQEAIPILCERSGQVQTTRGSEELNITRRENTGPGIKFSKIRKLLSICRVWKDTFFQTIQERTFCLAL